MYSQHYIQNIHTSFQSARSQCGAPSDSTRARTADAGEVPLAPDAVRGRGEPSARSRALGGACGLTTRMRSCRLTLQTAVCAHFVVSCSTQAVCASAGCVLHAPISSIPIYHPTRSRSISRDLGVTRFGEISPRILIDALDVVSCRARPVDAPTAWNCCEAPFWSRMVTCTVTLRDGLLPP